MTGTLVHPVEYGILHAMDCAFCEALNSEFADYRTRENEKLKHK
ncbi:hypothetical protein P106B_30 [Rhizobium phage vB_RglS_P106B]|uniref:Uncharacterized protein n=1 Tax=Rhizobium phage vB_RglS_P106B TaxID=1458697 RepID=W6E9P3_9CAUD|nr:hypothetical protein P106B_30 [Rhizobium phage vB_RglS_P106B]AHJ10713.1 hypothetical protein P106B_30 [Rhizobium phage vB_RglS_P106B]